MTRGLRWYSVTTFIPALQDAGEDGDSGLRTFNVLAKGPDELQVCLIELYAAAGVSNWRTVNYTLMGHASAYWELFGEGGHLDTSSAV